MKARAQAQDDPLPVEDGQEVTTQILTFRLGKGIFGIWLAVGLYMIEVRL